MSQQRPPFYLIFPLEPLSVPTSTNIRCDVIFGPSNSLKTSLLFQAAISLCKENLPVLFFRSKPLQYLPTCVAGMVQPFHIPALMDNLYLVYIDQLEHFTNYLANFPNNVNENGESNRSDTAMIIVDDFHHYMDQIEVDKLLEQRCAKLCCLLLELAEFCARKREGPVQVLVSCARTTGCVLKYTKPFNRYFDGLWSITPSFFNDMLVIEAQGNEDDLQYVVMEKGESQVTLNKVGTKYDAPFTGFN